MPIFLIHSKGTFIVRNKTAPLSSDWVTGVLAALGVTMAYAAHLKLIKQSF